MHRCGIRNTPQCPRCPCPIEDAQHVWVCNGGDAGKVFSKNMRDLDDWMSAQGTQPVINEAIILNLKRWHQGATPVLRSSFEPLNRVLESQAACGWEKFFEGNPVKGWARLQHDHFREIGSMKTGERWLRALIQKMWDTAWDQWDHQNGYVHKKELTAQDKELNAEIMEELRVGSAGLYG